MVRDLRPDEVQIFEDGVPQKVRHFEFFEGRTAAQAPEVAAAPEPAAPAPAAPAQPRSVTDLRDISVVSVVIGSLNAEGRKTTLDTMREFIKDEMRPNTYVGVFLLGYTLRPILAYTNDGEKIAAIMKQVASGTVTIPGWNYTPGPERHVNDLGEFTGGNDSGPGPDTIFPAAVNGPLIGPAADIARMMATHWVGEMHDAYQGSARELSNIQRLVQSQAEIPGRKVVLLFSSGLLVHPDTVEVLNNSISAANRSNVTVYAVDTRGFERSDLDAGRRYLAAASQARMRQQMAGVWGGDQTVTADMVKSQDMVQTAISTNDRGNLRVLAEGTGGELLSGSSDLREPLRRAMEEVRTHYELTYSPSNAEFDGAFRKIEVKVSRPGALVFTRSGYYALPVLNGQQVYPFEMATLKAINSRPLLHQFPFHVAALQFRPGHRRTQLAFVFEVAGDDLSIVKDKEWSTAHVAVTSLIKDEQGQVVDKISRNINYRVPAKVGVVSFTTPFLLPPGRYTMETAALDRESMKVSVHRSLLLVGSASGLAMSDVVLVRRFEAIQGRPNPTDPLQAAGGKVTPELADKVSPDSGGQVTFYAIAYLPVPADGPAQVDLEIARDGQTVMRSPTNDVPAGPGGTAPVLASLPAAKLTPGQYDARLTVRYHGQEVSGDTPFTVEVAR
jgi:VWFA-related protein